MLKNISIERDNIHKMQRIRVYDKAVASTHTPKSNVDLNEQLGFQTNFYLSKLAGAER